MRTTQVVAQLRTTDLDGTIRFYTDVLGFDVAFRYEDFYAGIRAGDQVFHLKLEDEKDPSIEFVDEAASIPKHGPTNSVLLHGAFEGVPVTARHVAIIPVEVVTVHVGPSVDVRSNASEDERSAHAVLVQNRFRPELGGNVRNESA